MTIIIVLTVLLSLSMAIVATVLWDSGKQADKRFKNTKKGMSR
jgi:flagellar basal body-associated protein FliL